ncbi:hypothetical protein TKK_0013123 [Trichogramma kaykai]|uniref:Nicastrin n=1 Tax=Trichogramma kaykai TaxID=54128 RepID=A0ABD2WJ47_9HYME
MRCLLFMLLFAAIGFGAAQKLRDMMYYDFHGTAACFRRHNGTHQFGCSSSRSGSVGVIQFVENEDDIVWLEKNATAGPYMIVLTFDMFTMKTLKRFEDVDVNGVLLYRNTSLDRPTSYSPDDSCPNRYSGYTTCNESWNPHGSSLLLQDWPFPMFYIEDNEVLENVKDCYLRMNVHDREKQNERSLCALEMKSFMFAALNSESCLKRGSSNILYHPTLFCDPIGDQNIHWPVGPMSDDIKNVIMVIAKLDSNSMYDNLVPGAGSTVTAIVTLLATATYLHMLNATISDTNIVFSLLNGETMDYIGSSRLVYDLKEGNFDALKGKTLKLEQISSVIELGQLGEGKIYLHSKNVKDDNPLLTTLKNELKADVLNNSVPPVSVQSFLKENSAIETLVIANHGETFVNNYYNGLLDDAEALDYSSNKTTNLPSSLANIAITLGNALYSITNPGSKPSTENITLIEKLVTELLPCYLESARCTLFSAASRPGTILPNQVLSLYTGVVRSDNAATILTGQLLGLLTGTTYPELNQTSCLEKHFLWMAGYNLTGVCVEATANFSQAKSPAFIIENYDMKSGKYSTWTESVWENLGMRMFLKPSYKVEVLSLGIGIGVSLFTAFIVWRIKANADRIFHSVVNL